MNHNWKKYYNEIKPNNKKKNKDVNGTILSHFTCHPKDISNISYKLYSTQHARRDSNIC